MIEIIVTAGVCGVVSFIAAFLGARVAREELPTAHREVKAGPCECGHPRALHVDGKGRCKHCEPRLKANGEKVNNWWCDCQVYIRDDDLALERLERAALGELS